VKILNIELADASSYCETVHVDLRSHVLQVYRN